MYSYNDLRPDEITPPTPGCAVLDRLKQKTDRHRVLITWLINTNVGRTVD